MKTALRIVLAVAGVFALAVTVTCWRDIDASLRHFASGREVCPTCGADALTPALPDAPVSQFGLVCYRCGRCGTATWIPPME